MPPIVLVQGTNEVGSAIARALFLEGWSVIALRDPALPVLRRKMAFDDALTDKVARLDGVTARPIGHLLGFVDAFAERRFVPVTGMNLAEVLQLEALGPIACIVDARINPVQRASDIRRLAPLTIGIGAGFVAGRDVHAAIEAMPDNAGLPVFYGPTSIPNGRVEMLGGAGTERFAQAATAGHWAPQVAIGDVVCSGQEVGTLGAQRVTAPLGGLVRGIVRSTMVRLHDIVVEIDPRGDNACWTGVTVANAAIAEGVCALLEDGVACRTSIVPALPRRQAAGFGATLPA